MLDVLTDPSLAAARRGSLVALVALASCSPRLPWRDIEVVDATERGIPPTVLTSVDEILRSFDRDATPVASRAHQILFVDDIALPASLDVESIDGHAIMSGGRFTPSDGIILVNASVPTPLTDIVTHELCHAIDHETGDSRKNRSWLQPEPYADAFHRGRYPVADERPREVYALYCQQPRHAEIDVAARRACGLDVAGRETMLRVHDLAFGRRARVDLREATGSMDWIDVPRPIPDARLMSASIVDDAVVAVFLALGDGAPPRTMLQRIPPGGGPATTIADLQGVHGYEVLPSDGALVLRARDRGMLWIHQGEAVELTGIPTTARSGAIVDDLMLVDAWSSPPRFLLYQLGSGPVLTPTESPRGWPVRIGDTLGVLGQGGIWLWQGGELRPVLSDPPAGWERLDIDSAPRGTTGVVALHTMPATGSVHRVPVIAEANGDSVILPSMCLPAEPGSWFELLPSDGQRVIGRLGERLFELRVDGSSP